jgi:hypothetical protein
VVVEASSEGGTARRSLEFEVLEAGSAAAEREAEALSTPED